MKDRSAELLKASENKDLQNIDVKMKKHSKIALFLERVREVFYYESHSFFMIQTVQDSKEQSVSKKLDDFIDEFQGVAA